MGSARSTLMPPGHVPHVFFTRARAEYTRRLASSQRCPSASPWASWHTLPAARSVEPSARHALRQSPAAMSRSRCEESTSLDAPCSAIDREVPGCTGATPGAGGGGGGGGAAYGALGGGYPG